METCKVKDKVVGTWKCAAQNYECMPLHKSQAQAQAVGKLGGFLGEMNKH
jgi:hypothetical protein